MILTKKHFETIALILKQSKNKDEIINALVQYFKKENPLFNEVKFLEAIK